MTLVRRFHAAFRLPAADHPTIPDVDLVALRARLIREEFEEVMAELDALMFMGRRAAPLHVQWPHLQNLLLELADLRYVIEGAAVTFGLDIDGAFAEVHRANMSKLDTDGKPLYRSDGKVLRGPSYSEADMTKFVPDIIEG
jgi:predicted HAD superfamily Cof-like phosphohydrolase